ncbi:YcxB family protein [Phaeobacter sp. CAU 1743]|uniref:YcxB family protein n=1 Tax=Phaeobacter sp. CAU 1743 TaxID=3140367 RepID=UPI00325AB0F5
MSKIELSFSLMQKEAREGIVLNARGKASATRSGIVWRYGKQLVLGVGLIAVAVILGQLFDHPDAIPEMFSMWLGAAAITSLWQFRWSNGIRETAAKMARFSEEFGPSIAVFDQGGVVLSSKTGTATIPWRAVGTIRTTKHVTILTFGSQILVVPHRVLPPGLTPMDFDIQLEDWKAAA